jgi:hypothetical protein
VELFVEHEFLVPTLLQEGIVVENLKQAAKAIESQLTMEGFSSQIGTLPVAMQIHEPAGGLRREAFSAAAHITNIHAEKNELIFDFDNSDEDQIEEIKNQLYLEVKAMLRKKRSTTVRMNQQDKSIIFTMTNLEHDGGVHPADLDWLEEKYKLNNTQLRKLTNVINEG